MPKILITGNGFDLYQGLPTSYEDFMKVLEYLESENSLLDFENIYSKTTQSEKIKENYTPFDFDQEEIKEFILFFKENSWYNLFKSEHQIDTWIDFEMKVEEAIENIKLGIELFKRFKDSMNNEEENSHLNKFNRRVIYFLNQIKIIEVNSKSSFDLSKDYLKIKTKYYNTIDINKTIKKITDSFIDFKIIFKEYLRIFVEPLIKKYKGETLLINNFEKHFTFNYTNTYEAIYKTNDITKHIHGDINNGIVLGINEISIENKEFTLLYAFIKSNQKLFLNSNRDFEKYLQNELNIKNDNKPNEKTEFYFFGHSLNKSDLYYLDKIFKLVYSKNHLELNNYPSKYNLYICYYDEKSKQDIINNLYSYLKEDELLDAVNSEKIELIKIGSEKFDSKLENSAEQIKYSQGFIRLT